MAKERLAAFTDAILAIIMTISFRIKETKPYFLGKSMAVTNEFLCLYYFLLLVRGHVGFIAS